MSGIGPGQDRDGPGLELDRDGAGLGLDRDLCVLLRELRRLMLDFTTVRCETSRT